MKNKVRNIEYLFYFLLGVLHTGFATELSGNQFQYLARALDLTPNQIKNDWFLQTNDANYLFTSFARFVIQLFGFSGTVMVTMILNGLGFIYLVKFGLKFLSLRNTIARLSFASILGLSLSNFSYEIDWGVAGLGIFSPSLQPSSFGTLLLPALYHLLAFLQSSSIRYDWQNRNLGLFTLFLSISLIFHPSLLISVAIIQLAFIYTSKRIKFPLLYSISTSLFILLITLVSNYRLLIDTLNNTNIEYLQAQTFLAVERIPYHAVPSDFLHFPDYLRLLIIFCAIIVTRNSVKLQSVAIFFQITFSVLAISLIWQLVAFSPAISLLLPWRISAALYPISFSICLASVLNIRLSQLQRNHKTIWISILVFLTLFQDSKLMFLCLLFFLVRKTKRHISRSGIALLICSSSLIFATQNQILVSNSWRDSKDIFRTSERSKLEQISSWGVGVTPMEYSNFRTEYKLPLYADLKSVPFFPRDLIEWRRRVTYIETLYSNPMILCSPISEPIDWIMLPSDFVPYCLASFSTVQIANYSVIKIRI